MQSENTIKSGGFTTQFKPSFSLLKVWQYDRQTHTTTNINSIDKGSRSFVCLI